MRLLWYGESPYIETGAGQVAKHLLPVFLEMFNEIHLVAINQWWCHTPLPPKLTIFLSPKEDSWNVAQAQAQIQAGHYDVCVATADINQLTDLSVAFQQARQTGKYIVLYAAMDCHVFERSFFQILTLADIPIVYSEWCKRLVLSLIPELHAQLQVIYHGCEPDVFFPLPPEERSDARKSLFNISDPETFLVLNVNRNQVRKDLARSMAAFHLFHLSQPNSLLYLHSKQKDLGGSLPDIARGMRLCTTGPTAEIIFAPYEYHESGGIARFELNKIYNAADCFITSSSGEGWGLTTTEAMAAGLPVIAGSNSVFPEILGENEQRGYLVSSGGPELWALYYGISDSPRELVSVQAMRDALLWVWGHRSRAREKGEAARKWTQKHSWAIIQQEWRKILAKAIREKT